MRIILVAEAPREASLAQVVALRHEVMDFLGTNDEVSAVICINVAEQRTHLFRLLFGHFAQPIKRLRRFVVDQILRQLVNLQQGIRKRVRRSCQGPIHRRWKCFRDFPLVPFRAGIDIHRIEIFKIMLKNLFQMCFVHGLALLT